MNRTEAYRLLTLAELGRIWPEALPAAQIAARREIPAAYLARLVPELAREGLVQSRRGAGGGLSLARDPASISLADVLPTADDGELPPLAAHVATVVNRAVTDALAAMSVADLVARDRPPAPEYSI